MNPNVNNVKFVNQAHTILTTSGNTVAVSSNGAQAHIHKTTVVSQALYAGNAQGSPQIQNHQTSGPHLVTVQNLSNTTGTFVVAPTSNVQPHLQNVQVSTVALTQPSHNNLEASSTNVHVKMEPQIGNYNPPPLNIQPIASTEVNMVIASSSNDAQSQHSDPTIATTVEAQQGAAMTAQVLQQQQQQQTQLDLQQLGPESHMLQQIAEAAIKTEPSSDMAESAESSMSMTTDTNIQVADSNSPKQSFVPCKVCGDKASGYHYGVTSCEGCKGFFRRSIQKQIEYRCLRDGKCLVIRLNRNRCQYCRFKKCLAVGMSRDSVRYGRVPKRTKSQDEQRVSTTYASGDQTALESKQLAIYDIILTISQAHHANCLLTEDKIKILARKPFSLLPKSEAEVKSGSTEEILEAHQLLMFQNLATLITPTIQQVVEFAKRVPGFHDLSQDDQLILIKAGFFEIWLTQQTRMFNHTDMTLTFGDGNVINKDELDAIYTADLAESMFDFAQSFTQLRLNDTEIGLFNGVVLATADRQGLNDVKGVEKIQDKLIEAIKLQISRNHSTEPHLFANVLMKLPELRMLGSKHADQLANFRQKWSKLRLPPLYSEIYDIPKSEEELQSS